MKKINIHYWYSDLSELTGIKHKASFDYSKEKRNELIDHFLDHSCEVMIRKFDHSLIIFIDNAGGRFRQR